MGKYSAGPTMVLEWTPTGSTVVTPFQAQARGLSISRSMDNADATGYGNTNRQYVATIADAGVDAELLLDDTSFTVQDLFSTPGAKGTLDAYPQGKTSGKQKISIPAFVSTFDRDFPFDDVAVASIAFMPTGNITESLVSP